MTDRNRDDGWRLPQGPRPEPEIIPPEKASDRPRGVWVSVSEHDGTRRVYVARPGPFTIVLALAILGLIAVLGLIVLLSLALIWIPVVIVLILAFVLTMYWRRLRSWLARR